MSRSFKKRPFVSYNATESEKYDKQLVNRRERHAVRQILYSDPLCDMVPQGKDFGDSREFGKDGKVHLGRYLVRSEGLSMYLWLAPRLRK